MAAVTGIPGGDGVASLAAGAAGLLDLLHHAGAQRPHDDVHPGPVAHLALVLAPRLGSGALTRAALDAAGQ